MLPKPPSREYAVWMEGRGGSQPLGAGGGQSGRTIGMWPYMQSLPSLGNAAAIFQHGTCCMGEGWRAGGAKGGGRTGVTTLGVSVWTYLQRLPGLGSAADPFVLEGNFYGRKRVGSPRGGRGV